MYRVLIQTATDECVWLDFEAMPSIEDVMEEMRSKCRTMEVLVDLDPILTSRLEELRRIRSTAHLAASGKLLLYRDQQLLNEITVNVVAPVVEPCSFNMPAP
jgi:hypothetical protein